jgi:acetylornithine deacetylase/succinyl-diaminopimelate desuccinylase-like protein
MGDLDADERALAERVAERRQDLVDLCRELIGYDTTSRAAPDEPARQEAQLQRAPADRLAGFAIDLWEPAPEDVADHPLSVPRADLRHDLLAAPDIVTTHFVADAGWHVMIPDRAAIGLAVLIVPQQADARGWTSAVREEVQTHLTRWCASDSWLAEHPPSFRWHTEVNPSETPVEAASVQALLAANEALGLPPELGGLGSWYDGATFALEADTPALMYGPSSIDRAHTVDEYVPIDDLVQCAQAIAIAGWRLCR